MRGLLAPLIKLTVFLVITAMATYVLATTIANSSFGDTNTYKADFSDVTGLNLGDDVRIAGVRVGTIDDIKLVKGGANTPSYTQITFSVQKSRPLPRAVEARLRYRNLVGQRYLDIEQGLDNFAPTADKTDPDCNLTAAEQSQTLKPGSVIPECYTMPAVDLTVLFQGFGKLTDALAPDQINKLSYALIQTLQGEGDGLVNLLSTVADLTNSLADKDQLIGDVIDNLSDLLVTVNNRDTELTSLIENLRTLVSGLAVDRTTIGNAIDGINNLATSTAGLLTQVRAPLKADVRDITGLVNNLNANSGVVTYVLQQLAPTVAGLIRTASYGSWFNFYLCHLSGTVSLPGVGSTDLGNLPVDSASTRAIRGCST